ncbi:hypothetical protein P8936_16525 [Edaphobacter paludis]|uniref:Uncharacterized protein n=1 Tax=Edaphobacter paludis TaxID=3035702 RepID=A0AAU7D7H1_9BACT
MNLPMMNDELLTKLTHIQNEILEKPQVEVNTEHVIHGGMYIRTIRLDADIVLVGALVKVSTVLIVSGKTAVFTGEGWIELDGYHVIPARAGRKQIFVTRKDTSITMIFPTDAKTVEQAEEEFTSEAEALMSRKNDNDTVVITGA